MVVTPKVSALRSGTLAPNASEPEPRVREKTCASMESLSSPSFEGRGNSDPTKQVTTIHGDPNNRLNPGRRSLGPCGPHSGKEPPI